MRSMAITCGLIAAALSTSAYAQNAPTPPRPAQPGPAQMQSSAPMKHSGEWRASKLTGLNVYNQQNEKIGDINEILLDQSGKVAGIVIGVGGFLGMGEHDVLVRLDQIKFINEPVRTSTTTSTTTTGTATTNRSASNANRPARTVDEKWYPDHAVMNATKEQLKAMPQFKYN